MTVMLPTYNHDRTYYIIKLSAVDTLKVQKMDSNPGSLVLEADSLPAVPQPQPYQLCMECSF